MNNSHQDELRVSADINGFIESLRALLRPYTPLDGDEIGEAHEDHDSHYNDTLDRGISLGGRDMADDVRAIAEKHGVVL